MLGFLRIIGLGLIWLLLAGLTAWAAAALYVDFPLQGAGLAATVVYLALVAACFTLLSGQRRKILACAVLFLLVLGWWWTLQPSNARDWQGDVAQTPWAEIDGDKVTIHNVRNFDYRTETDYTPNWETRTYDLKDVRGADIFLTFWGSPWIAHPIISFQFGDHDHLAFSVETRKEVGEEYSAFRGFFRQYELVYIIADERDVIRLRTNYRTGEEVYLYRSIATPETARAVFLDYLRGANDLARDPAFYNAITSNCTTNIRIHTKAVAGAKAAPWDWRLLLNGKSDEFAYQQGRLVGDLPFDQLKAQAHINEAARAADAAADFSDLIRVGRVGFGS